MIAFGRTGKAAVHATSEHRNLVRRDNSHPLTSYPTLWQRLALMALWVLLLSPLVLDPWLNAGKATLDGLFLFNLVTSLLWVTLCHLLVRRPFMLHLALLPLYLTTAVDLFLVGTFNARLSSGYVTIALTDHAEIPEFLSAYARPVALAAWRSCSFTCPASTASVTCKGRGRRSWQLWLPHCWWRRTGPQWDAAYGMAGPPGSRCSTSWPRR
jgi:hypothetical protein